MNLYEFTKKYGEGKGTDMMWSTVQEISDFVEDNMSEDDKKRLMRKLYCVMSDGHYNEEFAMEDVAKMYYKEANGNKRNAPYWTVSEVRPIYDSVKARIPAYNFWDFYVVLNMAKSDMCPLITEWFPGSNDEEKTRHLIEYSVSWLADEDNPFGNRKAWKYFNAK